MRRLSCRLILAVEFGSQVPGVDVSVFLLVDVSAFNISSVCPVVCFQRTCQLSISVSGFDTLFFLVSVDERVSSFDTLFFPVSVDERVSGFDTSSFLRPFLGNVDS